ncbi:hypothetical protein C8R43DRAFT_1240921 [Mycena crocata]|nr:hypothetical protein C8R43DRAFT_1240921 [Mycena crocata]
MPPQMIPFLLLCGLMRIPSLVSAGNVALTPEAYADSLSVDAIMAHLKEFQSYADVSGKTRAHGFPGYTASADYVYKIAQYSGLTVQRQGIMNPIGKIQVGTLFIDGVTLAAPDVTVGYYTNTTGPEGFTTELVAIPGYGCTEADFADTANKAVLVKAGQCDPLAKSLNAVLSSALAVIVYDETPLPPTSGAGVFANPPGRKPYPIVFSASYDVGQTLLEKIASQPGVSVTSNVEMHVEDVSSDNVIAQTTWGNPDKVIMVGAHLDSVPAGPGINDNGSGSATLAELIKQLVQFSGATHALRFAWWSTEEPGLLGSDFYVQQLTEAERAKIVAYINIDMSASPNYILGIQDSDNSGGKRPDFVDPPPVGSNAIEKLLQGVYESMNMNYAGFAIALNSDHTAFMNGGIPTCGLETGAGGLKTDLEVELFGGVAGEPYDHCYHRSCDRIDNIAQDALIINARAIARALATLANDISAIEAEQAQAAMNGGETAAFTAGFMGAAHPMSDLGRHEH